MVSNRLTHRRTTISNPKICKSKLKPLRPIAPPQPPQWPPDEIEADLQFTLNNQSFSYTLKLKPQAPPPKIRYAGDHPSAQATASIVLDTSSTPQTISFLYAARNASPSFYAAYGPTRPITPTAFDITNSTWQIIAPYSATITLTVRYPSNQ